MKRTPDERLNQLTKIITRAGGISDDEADSVASSPFLLARVQARVEAERAARVAPGKSWPATLRVASHAVAVLLVVTIAVALSFWISRGATLHRAANSDIAANNLDRVVTGGTCALSATEGCAISNDEVLATLFAEEGGKIQK